MTRVLVLGAAGFTGRAVTRALVARGASVRAFVRREDAEATVRAAGADEVAFGQYLDLPSVEAAARGADGMWFIGPRFMPEEEELGLAIVEIARRCGVRRFVFSGVYHPTIQGLVNHKVKVPVEDALYRSDLEFTVLQPARYMHGLLFSSWKGMHERGVMTDAFSPDARMSYVDYGDVAEAAAIAFTEDRLVRGTFELAATGERTLHELAALCGKELGRELRAEQAPLEQYTPAAPVLSNPYSGAGIRRLRDFYDAYGFRGGNSLVLRTILGREPTDFVSCMTAMRSAGALPG